MYIKLQKCDKSDYVLVSTSVKGFRGGLACIKYPKKDMAVTFSYYPQHCSTCFVVAKPGSTAKRLVVDYGELNKKTLNHSGSIPNMESTLDKIASCRYKTKMDKRSGFSHVDLTPNVRELLAFITPQERVFKRKVMPFGVANAPAPFQGLMNKILSILRRRPVVQELIS